MSMFSPLLSPSLTSLYLLAFASLHRISCPLGPVPPLPSVFFLLPLHLCYFHMSDVLHVCLSQTKMNAARTTVAASTSASTQWARTFVSVAMALYCMRTNMTAKKVGSTSTHTHWLKNTRKHLLVLNTFVLTSPAHSQKMNILNWGYTFLDFLKCQQKILSLSV